MGITLSRNINRELCDINYIDDIITETKDINKLVVLIDILRLENEKIKQELEKKIVLNNQLEEELSNSIILSKNLEERIAIENEYWKVNDFKEDVKKDHNEFINFHYNI